MSRLAGRATLHGLGELELRTCIRHDGSGGVGRRNGRGRVDSSPVDRASLDKLLTINVRTFDWSLICASFTQCKLDSRRIHYASNFSPAPE